MYKDINLDQFDSKHAHPSSFFILKTKIKLLFSYVGHRTLHWYHSLPKTIQVTALSSTTIAVFLMLLISYPTIAPMAKVAYFKATGKDATIFGNYTNVRSQNALAAENFRSSLNLSADADAAPAKDIGVVSPLLYYAPTHDDSQIVVTKTRTITGAGISLCPDYSSYYANFVGDQINEYAYYKNYSKSKLSTASGEVIELYVTNDLGSYEYRGGSYAVLRELPAEERTDDTDLQKLSLDAPLTKGESMPVETIEPVEPIMELVTELNAINPETYNLVTIENLNGKDYFVYEYTYDYSCSSTMEGTNQTLPAIQRTWIDPETYMTVKDILYFKNVSETTKLYETTTAIEFLDPSQKDTYFSFDIDTTIKVIPYISEADVFSSWLASKSAHALIPTDNTYWTISGITSMQAMNTFYTDQSSYLTDRSFYAKNALGDYYFGIFSTPSSSISYEDRALIEQKVLLSLLDVSANNLSNGTWMNTSMYDGVIEEKTLRQYMGLIGEGYTTEQTALVINGETIPASKTISTYEQYYEIPAIEPAPTGYPEDMPRQGVSVNHYYYAIYNGNTYFVTISGEETLVSNLTSANLAFTDLFTQRPEDLEKIKALHNSMRVYPEPLPLVEPAQQ